MRIDFPDPMELAKRKYQRELKAWKQRKKAWEKEKRRTLEGLKEMLVYGYPEPKPQDPMILVIEERSEEEMEALYKESGIYIGCNYDSDTKPIVIGSNYDSDTHNPVDGLGDSDKKRSE